MSQTGRCALPLYLHNRQVIGNDNGNQADNLSSLLYRSHGEYQYLDAISRIMSEGVVRQDRTGTGTKSVFGMQFRYNLRDGECSLRDPTNRLWLIHANSSA